MQGRRVYPDLIASDSFPLLAQGEYRKVNGKWHAQPPWDHGGANLASHDVVEHVDGAISVLPSILVTSIDAAGMQVQWHGYLENGFWREC